MIYPKEYEHIEIVKKFDSKLKVFVHYCRYKNLTCKFIDSKANYSFEVAKYNAIFFLVNNCFETK